MKNRIVLSFIGGPKIQACRHFLTNQIRIFTYLFWSLNIFLLINFWAGFSRMFLFCVFSWLVEKYKNVSLMLMRLWSEISRMFLCMFLGLTILRKKMSTLYGLLVYDLSGNIKISGRNILLFKWSNVETLLLRDKNIFSRFIESKKLFIIIKLIYQWIKYQKFH